MQKAMIGPLMLICSSMQPHALDAALEQLTITLVKKAELPCFNLNYDFVASQQKAVCSQMAKFAKVKLQSTHPNALMPSDFCALSVQAEDHADNGNAFNMLILGQSFMESICSVIPVDSFDAVARLSFVNRRQTAPFSFCPNPLELSLTPHRVCPKSSKLLIKLFNDEAK